MGAIDYLLKPIAYTDFLSAAQRVLTVVGRQAAEEVVCKPNTVTDNLPAEDDNTEAVLPVEDGMFFVKSDYKYVRVSCQDILYIEGLKDYVKCIWLLPSVPLCPSCRCAHWKTHCLPHPS